MSDETIRENQEALAQLAEESPESMGLVAQIMYASARENEAVGKRLYDIQERKYHQAQARLRLIREDIEDLFRNPWVPQPELVLQALYPSDERVEALTKALMGEEEA